MRLDLFQGNFLKININNLCYTNYTVKPKNNKAQHAPVLVVIVVVVHIFG